MKFVAIPLKYHPTANKISRQIRGTKAARSVHARYIDLSENEKVELDRYVDYCDMVSCGGSQETLYAEIWDDLTHEDPNHLTSEEKSVLKTLHKVVGDSW